MTIKQKIDKYLKDNYSDVVFETKVKGFRWQTIADKIGKDINKDVVKERWKVVKKKMEDFNNIETSKFIAEKKQQLKPMKDLIEPIRKEFLKEVKQKLEEAEWKKIEKDTIEDVMTKRQKESNLLYNPPKETKSWNLITFLKNLFKNL